MSKLAFHLILSWLKRDFSQLKQAYELKVQPLKEQNLLQAYTSSPQAPDVPDTHSPLKTEILPLIHFSVLLKETFNFIPLLIESNIWFGEKN